MSSSSNRCFPLRSNICCVTAARLPSQPPPSLHSARRGGGGWRRRRVSVNTLRTLRVKPASRYSGGDGGGRGCFPRLCGSSAASLILMPMLAGALFSSLLALTHVQICLYCSFGSAAPTPTTKHHKHTHTRSSHSGRNSGNSKNQKTFQQQFCSQRSQNWVRQRERESGGFKYLTNRQ